MSQDGAGPTAADGSSKLSCPYGISEQRIGGLFSLMPMDRREPTDMVVNVVDHTLTLHVAGAYRLRQKADGRASAGLSTPGALLVLPANLSVRFEAREPARFINFTIPQTVLSRVLVQHWDREPRTVDILPRFLARDPVVEAVLMHLDWEARNGSPSGTLYAESAAEFLAEHVLHAHSSAPRLRTPLRGGISPTKLKLVIDYIHENLGGTITLLRMAELVGVSVRHFARAFRQATGVPPHEFVLSKRVEAARSLLLLEPTLSIEDVAVRVGFSSASHLALHFRRATGHTPTAFRRACN